MSNYPLIDLIYMLYECKSANDPKVIRYLNDRKDDKMFLYRARRLISIWERYNK